MALGEKGHLINVALLTEAERDAIDSPQSGLLIFNKDADTGTGKLNIYVSGAWEEVTSS